MKIKNRKYASKIITNLFFINSNSHNQWRTVARALVVAAVEAEEVAIMAP